MDGKIIRNYLFTHAYSRSAVADALGISSYDLTMELRRKDVDSVLMKRLSSVIGVDFGE